MSNEMEQSPGYRFFDDILPTFLAAGVVFAAAGVLVALQFSFGPLAGSNSMPFENVLFYGGVALMIALYSLPVHFVILFSFSHLPAWVRAVSVVALYVAGVAITGVALCVGFNVAPGAVLKDAVDWLTADHYASWQFGPTFQAARTFLKLVWGLPPAILITLAPIWLLRQLFALRLKKAGRPDHKPPARAWYWWVAAVLLPWMLIGVLLYMFATPQSYYQSNQWEEMLALYVVAPVLVNIAAAFGLWSLLRVKDLIFGVGISTIPFFLAGLFFGAVAYETGGTIAPAIAVPLTSYAFACGPLLALRFRGWRIVAG